MAEDNRPIVYDVDGYDVITNAIVDLCNEYPALEAGDEIRFSFLDTDDGKAIFLSSNPVIAEERVSITDHVFQRCSYSFSVVYRAAGLSETRRIAIKEWLDNLGRWLEKQSIYVNGVIHHIDAYPELSDTRRFDSITRTSPAYLYAIKDNQYEDWVIYLDAIYINEFDR